MRKYLPALLKHRIQLRKAVQTPNDDGGFDRSYELLAHIYADAKPLSYLGRGIAYTRNSQTNEAVTHEFIVRYGSLKEIGSEYGLGFLGSVFDGVYDTINAKADYFIFMEEGDNNWGGSFLNSFDSGFDLYWGIEAAKGRLFRIRGVIRADERREYVKIMGEEIEEFGTGLSI